MKRTPMPDTCICPWGDGPQTKAERDERKKPPHIRLALDLLCAVEHAEGNRDQDHPMRIAARREAALAALTDETIVRPELI